MLIQFFCALGYNLWLIGSTIYFQKSFRGFFTVQFLGFFMLSCLQSVFWGWLDDVSDNSQFLQVLSYNFSTVSLLLSFLSAGSSISKIISLNYCCCFNFFVRLVIRCDWLLRKLIYKKVFEASLLFNFWASLCCYVYKAFSEDDSLI